MQRARAPKLLALLVRRQQQQQQQAQVQAEALAAAFGSSGGQAGIAAATAATPAATLQAAAAAAATRTALPWAPLLVGDSYAAAAAAAAAEAAATQRPWSNAQPHHRTFFSWTGRNSSSPKLPPADLDGDASSSAAASAAAAAAATSSSPTAAGTGLVDRFDAAAAGAAAASSSGPEGIIDAAAAADFSAAAAAVVDAARSAEAEAFTAAAADVWAPTRAFMSLLETASDAWGLPWWATIALVNLAVRGATLPLTIYTQKKAGGMAAINEKMAQVRELAAASSRATSMREFQALQARRAAAMAELQAKHSGELRSSLVVPALGVLNAVVLVSQFSAVSTLASEGVPSMARGGALWFPDLTVPDARYGLAAVCSALTLAMVEFGGLTELGQTMPGAASGGMRWFLRGMALLFLPAGAYVPAAVGVLWTSNAVLSLAQSTALRAAGVRAALGLPDMAKVRADQRKALGAAAAGGGGGGLFAALTGGAATATTGGAGTASGGAASAAGAAPPPGRAPASSLLSTGRLYAQPAPSRKSANQIRAEVEKRLRR
jgi:YidC/Oxa1 family membrane protein insertase